MYKNYLKKISKNSQAMFALTKTLLILFCIALAAIIFGMFDLAVSFGTIDSAARDSSLVLQDFLRSHSHAVAITMGILLLSAVLPRIFGHKHVS